MKKNILIISGMLCITISRAFAYSEPECELPIDVFQEYAKSSSNCDPTKITKVAYYNYIRGWMVIGEKGNKNTCKFKINVSTNTVIDGAVLGDQNCKSSSTYTILTSSGVPYGCASDSDCDTINGWVCDNINSTYGVGICTQKNCGSNCQIGTGAWHDSSGTPGYQEQVVTKCNENSNKTYSNYDCSHTPIARCAPGYYGSNPKAAPYSGCTKCPTDTKYNATASSVAGATIITQCYLPKDVSHTDTTGTFKFTNNCYYKS